MRIPESVAAYLQDGGVRRAIVGMREIGGDGLLDGLDWDELPRFYAALQAARQFETEWAILGCALWEATWGGLLECWRPLSPDEQHDGRYGAGLSIDRLLDVEDGGLWFGRVFTARDWILYATVAGAPGRGIVVKAYCATGGRSTRFPSLADAPDEEGNWCSRPVPLDAGEIEVGALRAVATAAAAELPVRPRTSPGAGATAGT